jgi:cytochrome o ubiquinol oxidase subunit 1
MIWHIWWLAIIGIFGVIVTVIIRATSGENEEIISVEKLKNIEAEHSNWRTFA